jgi:hypothetical protein
LLYIFATEKEVGMHEWRGGSLMLGVRRGFVDKISSGSGRVHHSDRYRRFSPERRRYSDIFSRRRNSMDFEERPIPVREYRGHYRRDSGSHGLFFFLPAPNELVSGVLYSSALSSVSYLLF